MELVPGKAVFPDCSPDWSGAALSATASEARRRTYVVLSIAGLALLLRLYGISSYPLEGDEYKSIWAAKSVGLNWNSIIYSSLMHFWLSLGSSEFWLRLPAAIFGTATVPILFKIGERLGGWRTAVVAGLLAAISPFNIYHSQEVRFYSFFIFAAAAFMLATVSYVDSRRTARDRLWVLLTGLVLLVSHFAGVLALYAQGTAVFVAGNRKWRLRNVFAVAIGLSVLIFGLPLIPFFHNRLLYLYQVLGNGRGADLSSTPLSLLNFAKLAFAGYTFVFGYHVYPGRLMLAIGGLALSSFLVGCGIVKLWRQPKWRALPFTYLLALIGVYFVLDSIGGRVAGGVAPRHVAFVWPAFVLMLALGLSLFRRPVFHVLLVAVVGLNAVSLWYGWQKDWTYGTAIDYRSSTAFAAPWLEKNGAIISDSRAGEAGLIYFPREAPKIELWAGSSDQDFNQTLRYRYLVLVTADWRQESRITFDQLLRRLSGPFTWIDGRVDYPLFEYVLERKPVAEKPGYTVAETGQVRQPLSFYGGEFQDLRLPLAVKVNSIRLQVVGAYGLPDAEGNSEVMIPLSQPTQAGKLILLTTVVGLNQTPTEQPIAEVVMESGPGASHALPLRLNRETAAWDQRCQPTADCKTVFQWHKRMAMVAQKTFPDAWRDFPAGLHGVGIDLPSGTKVTGLRFRYLAGSGHLYVWGIAVAP